MLTLLIIRIAWFYGERVLFLELQLREFFLPYGLKITGKVYARGVYLFNVIFSRRICIFFIFQTQDVKPHNELPISMCFLFTDFHYNSILHGMLS